MFSRQSLEIRGGYRKPPNLGCFFKISCISLVLSKLPESLKYIKRREVKHLIIRYLTSLVLVGHLGLEIRLVETHRLRCLLSAQPVQTNGTEEITVGES